MTVTGREALILDALLAKVATLVTGSPTLPVAYPEIEFDPAVDATDGKYLEVSYFPNRPAWEGLTSGKLDQGLLQVAVVWPKNGGLVAPMEVAALVMAHFAKNTMMFSGSAKVKVNREPWASSPLIDTDRVSIPVTIPWAA